MEHNINQNKKAKVPTTSKKEGEPKAGENAKVATEKEELDDEPGYPKSLNEDLDSLLEKDPRRFFGGCGG